MKQAYLLFTLLVFYSPIALAQSPNSLSFPLYSITMAPKDLAALEADPKSDTTYPATLKYGDTVVDCTVRFRGSSSRNYPKKSWKIKFDDDNNPFHIEEMNLNADYIDETLLRNYLANHLFAYFGIPAPLTSYVNLNVNGEHKGVFVQIEQVGELFFERNGKEPGNFYKALMHSANMAPLAHDSDFPRVWEPKENTPSDFSDLKEFFYKVYYWNDEDFLSNIDNILDVDEFIMYFALVFSIASNDNYTKNLFLYHNPETSRFEVFPWDNDASFGINWQGDYYTIFESFIYGTLLDNQTVFRRLMEHTYWRELFWSDVRHITSDGFLYLDACIDMIYEDLQHDIFLDTCKPGSNDNFSEKVDQLRTFLTNRSNAMVSANGFFQTPLTTFEIDSPFIGLNETDITVRVTSATPQVVSCRYTDDLNLSIYADTFETSSTKLYDDGNHDDYNYSDGVYGGRITLPEGFRGYVPIMFESSVLDYPLNGFLYLNYIRNHYMILNAMNISSDDIQDLTIGTCYKFNGKCAVEIINTSINKLDISFIYLRCGEYYNRILFPENTVLESGQRIIVTTDSYRSIPFFPDDIILENECPEFAIGDTLALLAPDLTIITEQVCGELQNISMETDNIVINEINYHSADEFDSEDWIELYNAEDYPVDLSYWSLCDCDDAHRFDFYTGTIIEPHSYLIIARDTVKFRRCFPDITPFVDNLNFGFNASGETIRLFESNKIIVDSLTYDDKQPWPEKPDGFGATLSLVNPSLDNSRPENWKASIGFGTPGKQNDIYSFIDDDNPMVITCDGLSSAGNYPNPFNAGTTIPFSLARDARVRIDVYSITGQHVKTILNSQMTAGEHTVLFTREDLPSGIYVYQIHTTSSDITGRMVLLK